jgi:hypothetical protein
MRPGSSFFSVSAWLFNVITPTGTACGAEACCESAAWSQPVKATDPTRAVNTNKAMALGLA